MARGHGGRRREDLQFLGLGALMPLSEATPPGDGGVRFLRL